MQAPQTRGRGVASHAQAEEDGVRVGDHRAPPSPRILAGSSAYRHVPGVSRAPPTPPATQAKPLDFPIAGDR
jgi:hypothetical protein